MDCVEPIEPNEEDYQMFLRDYTPCPMCGGSGKKNYHPCSQCDGMGWVRKEKP